MCCDLSPPYLFGTLATNKAYKPSPKDKFFLYYKIARFNNITQEK